MLKSADLAYHHRALCEELAHLREVLVGDRVIPFDAQRSLRRRWPHTEVSADGRHVGL
ncbi:protein of unknown function (plasmid) [Caballeronia sp. S22]